AFHDATGRPISIVAESEGALVAKTFLTTTPSAPVDQLIMLSPLVQPGRVYYPPAGHEGWGVATGAGLSGLSAGLNTIAPFRLTVWAIAERLIEGASSAWQVPTLPLALNRAWSHGSSACPS